MEVAAGSSSELAQNGVAVPGDPLAEQDSTLAEYLTAVSDAATFFQPDGVLIDRTKQLLTALHALLDASISVPASQADSSSASALRRLHTAGFDAEQIWTQVDSKASTALKRARARVRHLPEDLDMLDPEMDDAVNELLQRSDGAPAGVRAGTDAAAGPAALSDASGSSEGGSSGREGGTSSDDSDAAELQDLDYDALLQAGPDAAAAGGSASAGRGAHGGAGASDAPLLPAEDTFLRLADMDAFVRQGEAAEGLGDRGGLAQYDAALRHVARHDAAARGALGDDAVAMGALRRKRSRQQALGAGGDVSDGGSGEAGSGGSQADGGREADGGSESDVDLFQGSGGDGEAPDGSAAAAGDAGIMYAEFFGRGQAQPAPAPDASGASPSPSGSESGSDGAGGGSASDEGADAAPSARPDTAGAGADGAAAELTPHQRRVARIQRQIAEMEEAALRGQEWHMRGEVSAAARPKDSALELDLDFEQTLRPPPQPTTEAATALEELVKRRIAELRFDNVVRVLPAAPRRETEAPEFDDAKSRAGLADLYEGQGGAAAAGRAAKQAKIRAEARQLFAVVCAKLDALSHSSLAAKPVTADLEVTVSAPAVAMEDAAPVTMSAADMQAPEEKGKDAALKAEGELSQAERQRQRAARKRVAQRKAAEREDAAGAAAHPQGIKSARAEQAAAREAKRQRKAGGAAARKGGAKGGTTSSAGMFARLHAEAEAPAAQKRVQRRTDVAGAQAASMKL